MRPALAQEAELQVIAVSSKGPGIGELLLSDWHLPPLWKRF